MVTGRSTLFICALALAAPSLVRAAEKPLWEFGLGAGALLFPDYRGADESHLFPVPVPYFVYRGRLLKADRDGARAELFDRDLLDINLSLNATIPVESDNNAARSGMPDLRPTIELGPSFDWHLWRSGDGRFKLDLVMPVRLPVTLESSPQALGWVFSPRINIDIDDVAGHAGWDFGAGVGPVFAEQKFHRYFYSVAPEFATPTRGAYEADGGYSGLYFVAAVSKRFPKYWVGAYLRYDRLDNAVFEPSPLVRSHSSFASGIGIAWMIGESKRKVSVEDDDD